MTGFVFHTVGGRYIVLGFFGSAAEPAGQRALEFVRHKRTAFDDEQLSFFGVSVDPEDESADRVQQTVPGIRFLWDFDRTVSRLYGAAPESGDGPYRHRWVVLNPGMQVLAVLPFRADGSERRDYRAIHLYQKLAVRDQEGTFLEQTQE